MLAYILIILAIATRVVPHFSNVSAITAVAIFSGAILPKRQAFVIPLAARLITDSIIGFFSWPLMIAVYGAHVFGVLLGLWVKNGKQDFEGLKVITSSMIASVTFFLVTNFAFLYPTYSHNLQGIVSAYNNGLPFLRGTVIGDLGYTVSLFAVYGLIQVLSRQAKDHPANQL